MPNWVRNIVKMEGIGTLPLYKTAEDGSEQFDFQTLIPMPESLNLPSGSKESVATEAAFRRIADALRRDNPFGGFPAPSRNAETLEKRVKSAGMTLEEAEELGLKYLLNAFRYDHASWYGWAFENWGTKWNGVNLERIDKDTIAFDTAWSNPEPIIMKLSERYPERVMEHWWADEDMGVNTGYRRVENGRADVMEPPDCGPYAMEIYVKCWGMDDCLERDEHGNLHVVEESDEEDGR